MSLKALSWAFNHKVSPTPKIEDPAGGIIQLGVNASTKKLVLITLANFCNESGKSYPSVATIEKVTQQKDEIVRRALDALVSDGIISDTGERQGTTSQIRVWQLPESACEIFQKQRELKIPQGGSLSQSKDPPKDPLNGNQPNISGTKEQESTSLRLFTDAWVKAFQEQFGRKYTFQNGKDAKAAKSMIECQIPVDEIIRTAKKAWAQRDAQTHWHCVHQSISLCAFAAKFNEIKAELSRDLSKSEFKVGKGPL